MNFICVYLIFPLLYYTVIYQREMQELTFKNFQGSISPHTLYSAYTECQYDIIRQEQSNTKPVKVVCNILQKKCWVKQEFREHPGDTNSVRLLIHENGHFRICLLAAKMLQQAIDSVDLTKPDSAIPTIQKIRMRIDKISAEMSQRYEQQTDHGRFFLFQQQWNDTLNSKLISLKNVKVDVIFK